MRRILLVGFALLFCAPAAAQTLGTITGEVRDSTGGLVPGATVTVVNQATNATRTTQTNGVGLFDFPALPPGNYTVKSELEGFKAASRDLELQVQQTARVNFTLELGTISEQATVTGVSPLVETANATIGTVIENRRIVELPLNGRNYLQLVALSPNVSAEFAGAGQSGDRQGGTRANQQLSIPGSAASSITTRWMASTTRMSTSIPTSFCRRSTRSKSSRCRPASTLLNSARGESGERGHQVGLNSLRGTLFEFHRDDALDAKNYAFTAAQAATPKAPFKWDQLPATRQEARSGRTTCSSCLISKGTGTENRARIPSPCRPWRCGTATSRNCWPTSGRSTHRPVSGSGDHRRPDAVHGRRQARGPAIRSLVISSGEPHERHLQEAVEFYLEPNSGVAILSSNNILSLQNREIKKYQYTQPMDLDPELRIGLDGPLQLCQRERRSPASKLNGTKLDTRAHQVALGNTWTPSSSLVNELYGFNDFFNTFGRELAFVRDVVKELAIPGISEYLA